MPYRRLPNTDAARVRALKRALELGKKYSPETLAFRQSTLNKILAFLPIYEQAILMQKESHTRQVTKSNEYASALKKARLYISHFIQVFNFAIIRGEIKPEARRFFGINPKDARVPDLATEAEVMEWGNRIIKGDNDRIAKRGTPVLNPKIAVVKVYFDEFVEKLNFQKMLQSISLRANAKVSEMRPECDALITQLWNEIETYFSDETPARKREQASYYGVSYVYRPRERASVQLSAAS